jgi:dolichol-phosphate mannosyltransferase
VNPVDQAASAPQSAQRGGGRPFVSVITPAYNETENLKLLHERLASVLGPLDVEWEWIVVDDHSRDTTFDVIRELAAADPRVRGLRLARNSGSHAAITCGLHHAAGDAAVIMAADLQDPPETLPDLLREWQNGAQVVWAVRRSRPGEKASTVGFARLYYFMMRRFVGMKEMPATGADFFFIDRRVLDAFREFGEANVNLMALITWMGFRQATVEYDKQVRQHGASGWTFEKKIKLTIDSITAFTYLPIRFMTYVGFVVALLGFAYAIFIVAHHFVARTAVEGWSSLMAAVLVLGGIQMLMLGVLGEYLWRVLDETRQRPRYLIEDTIGVRR